MSDISGINSIRFSGLASGLDTESIIKDLMKLEQSKVDRIAQQKTLLEWKRDDYREINTKLLALRNTSFDMKLQGTFMTMKTSSSNESVLTATASVSAVEGNYSLEVTQMAKAAYFQSTPVDGFTSQAGTFTVTGAKGSAQITVAAEDILGDILAKINDVADQTGVRASYDENINRIFLMSSESGSQASIRMTANDAAGQADLQGLLGGTFEIGVERSLASGQDAVVSVNGGSSLTFSANSFSLLGMTINLKSEGTASLAVSRDTDAVVDKIKTFVENYNAVMEKISSKTSEKRYRDFPPLTEEQKKDMSEKDIELWEEKARSGLLSSESLLKGVYNQIRFGTMGAVEGTGSEYKTLSSIGITTASWYDQGKLYIDETKLREALTEDPEGVMKLFTNSSEVDSEKGIAQRLCDNLDSAMANITDKAGRASTLVDQSYLGKEIERTEDRLEEMEERLLDIEERYWTQFTAMEKALQQMQSQSNWLMAQLGMGGQ